MKAYKRFGIITAIVGAFAVIIGAFAAHGLKNVLAPEQLATIKTAVLYQFLHCVVLVSLLLKLPLVTPRAARILQQTCISFLLGILLFSGSLYGLILAGATWLGPITPLGGLALIVGWLNLSRYFLIDPIMTKVNDD